MRGKEFRLTVTDRTAFNVSFQHILTYYITVNECRTSESSVQGLRAWTVWFFMDDYDYCKIMTKHFSSDYELFWLGETDLFP